MISESPLNKFLIVLTLGVCATAMPLIGQEAGGAVEPKAEFSEPGSSNSVDSGDRAKAQAHFAAGVSWEAQGKVDKALESFRLSLEADPSNTKLAVQVAEKYIGLKKFEEAYQTLLPTTRQENAPGKAFQLLGLIQMARGEDAPSLESFQMALERDPSLILSRQRLVDVHLRNGEEGPAIRKVQEAVEATSNEVDHVTALIGMYLRYVAMRPDRLEDLADQFEALIVKSSAVAEEQPALKVPISDILMLQERFDDAEKMLQDLKDVQPPVPLVREKLVDLFLRVGKKEKAVAELNELTKQSPDNPRPYFLLGTLKADEGEAAEAEKQFRKAIAVRPEFEPPYYELAAMKLNEGDAREALKVLQQARDHFSDQFILEFYSGLAMSALHRYEPSLRFLRQAESIAKKQEPGRLTGFFYFRMGSVLERLGKFKEAEIEFLKCLDLTPDDATTLNYLGYMWAEQGEKLDQAHEWIQKAHDLEPESEAILDSMGWVLFQKGEPAEALPFLEKAQEKLTEPDPTILDHLADVYEALGEFEKAEEAWRQSLEIEFNEKVFEKWRALKDKAEIKS
jgi:tetratricopeptide (TPR) repeat protein